MQGVLGTGSQRHSKNQSLRQRHRGRDGRIEKQTETGKETSREILSTESELETNIEREGGPERDRHTVRTETGKGIHSSVERQTHAEKEGPLETGGSQRQRRSSETCRLGPPARDQGRAGQGAAGHGSGQGPSLSPTLLLIP